MIDRAGYVHGRSLSQMLRRRDDLALSAFGSPTPRTFVRLSGGRLPQRSRTPSNPELQALSVRQSDLQGQDAPYDRRVGPRRRPPP